MPSQPRDGGTGGKGMGRAAIAALAYPPLFHFFVLGQIPSCCWYLLPPHFSPCGPNVRGCRTGLGNSSHQAAVPRSDSAGHPFGGGWRMFAGLLVSVATQLVLARLYFASA